MANTEIQRVIHLFEKTFTGNAWHGPAVMEVLADLTIEETLNKIENSHTIAELVEHMITWRQFVVKKLEGDALYDVPEHENFRSVSTITEKDWKATLERLQLSQETLLNLLKSTPDNKLNETVGNRNYNYYTLLHGIIQHDIYHLGQIVLMRKL